MPRMLFVWIRSHLLGVLCVATVVAALLMGGFYLASGQCVTARGNSSVAQVASGLFRASPSCGADSKRDEPEIIFGVGIVVLSGAALGFWISTAKSDRAKSLRGLISFGPKRARLRIEKIAVNRLEADAEHPDERYELMLTWRNQGRSTANVTRIGIGSTIAAMPPHVPMFRFFEGSAVTAAVEANEEYVFRATNHMAIAPEQRQRIELGVVHQWLWGEIRYENGQGQINETGFVAVRDARRPVWRMRGPAEYTYERVKQS